MTTLKLNDILLSDSVITPENIANLPEAPKLKPADANIQQRVLDIICGTVARGTESKWGIPLHSDSDIIIGGENDPNLRILNILEEIPFEHLASSSSDSPGFSNQPTFYKVTYIYVYNNGIVPDANITQQFTSGANSFFQKISKHLDELKFHAQPLQNYLSSITYMVNSFWKFPFNPNRQGEFAGLLIFSRNIDEIDQPFEEKININDGLSVISMLWGRNSKCCIMTSDVESQFNIYPFTLIGDKNLGKTNTSLISTKCKRYLVFYKKMLEVDASNLVQRIFEDLNKKIAQNVYVNKNDLLCYLFDHINIPCFEWVGNCEEIYQTGALSVTEDLRKIRKLTVLKNGSCTLNMSLTMMQLRKQGELIMYLNNAGGIAGCKCYSNAASTNGLLSFLSEKNAFYNLNELILCDEPDMVFKLFNSNHCDGTINKASDYQKYFGKTREFLFIDFETAVRIFTRRHDLLLNKHSRKRGSDFDSEFYNQTAKFLHQKRFKK